MYEKLSVKDLWKYCHVWPDDNPYDVHKLVAEAAEAIEKLQSELKQVKAEKEALLKEKAGQEAAQETCPCKNDLKACCTCVSMYCYECINKSEYVMGSFCSCCGRKLK